MIDAYWPGALPSAPPEAITETSTSDGQKGLHPANVGTCKVLRFRLPGGIWCTACVYTPVLTPRRAALIYHSGHSSDYTLNWIAIGAALARGYIVAEIFMSGYQTTVAPWDNASYPATYTLDGGGTISIMQHNDLATVAAAGGRVLPVFLDPVFRTVQWLRDRLQVQRIALAGHSGGGWAALLCGALDTRIDLVASIHGWCPLGVAGRPTGDYEQNTGAPWLTGLGMDYLDYSAMIGARRQLVVTGSLDDVFGAGVLGQGNIDAWRATVAATGANIAGQTFTAPNHDMTAAEVAWVLDEFDALGCPNYVAPRRATTLAACQDIARIVNLLAGYPARGTAAVAAVDLGAGNGRVDLSAQDYARLYDAAQVATLSGADQVIVAAQRGAFTSR